jgi:hypothetical protein
MRAFLATLSISLLLWGHASFAQTVTGAKMTWYGNYTAGEVSSQKDSGSVTGTKNFVSGITPPSTSTDQIRAVLGTRFGFGYELIGAPSSASVIIRHVYKIPPPGIRDAATGQLKLDDEARFDLQIGQKALFIGRVIGYNFPTGRWTYQIWYADRMLLEKSFTVVAP